MPPGVPSKRGRGGRRASPRTAPGRHPVHRAPSGRASWRAAARPPRRELRGPHHGLDRRGRALSAIPPRPRCRSRRRRPSASRRARGEHAAAPRQGPARCGSMLAEHRRPLVFGRARANAARWVLIVRLPVAHLTARQWPNLQLGQATARQRAPAWPGRAWGAGIGQSVAVRDARCTRMPRPSRYRTTGTRGSGSMDPHASRTRSRAGSNEQAMVRTSPARALR